LGFINEAQLLEALAEQSRCPAARALELATAPSEVRALLPEDFCRRHLVVPFNRRGKQLDIAAVNPNDALLVEEISSLTGLVVRSHVATEAAITAALAIPVARPRSAEAPAPGAPRSRHWQWTQFWRVASTPQEAFQALAFTPAPAASHALASFPDLTPISASRIDRRPEASADGLAAALLEADNREAIAAAVLAFLASQVTRVALFALHKGKVTGWALRGGGQIAQERFLELVVTLERPSVFLNLSAGADLHCGPVSQGDGNDAVLAALGEPLPAAAVVVPLMVRGKAAGFLWVDNGAQGVTGIAIPQVNEVAALASLALEVLVLRKKIRDHQRLTGSRGRSRVALPNDGGRDDQG